MSEHLPNLSEPSTEPLALETRGDSFDDIQKLSKPELAATREATLIKLISALQAAADPISAADIEKITTLALLFCFLDKEPKRRQASELPEAEATPLPGHRELWDDQQGEMVSLQNASTQSLEKGRNELLKRMVGMVTTVPNTPRRLFGWLSKRPEVSQGFDLQVARDYLRPHLIGDLARLAQELDRRGERNAEAAASPVPAAEPVTEPVAGLPELQPEPKLTAPESTARELPTAPPEAPPATPEPSLEKLASAAEILDLDDQAKRVAGQVREVEGSPRYQDLYSRKGSLSAEEQTEFEALQKLEAEYNRLILERNGQLALGSAMWPLFNAFGGNANLRLFSFLRTHGDNGLVRLRELAHRYEKGEVTEEQLPKLIEGAPCRTC